MKKLHILIFLFSSLGSYGQSNPYSINFDGIDDYLSIGNQSQGNLDFDSTDSFSLIAWIKTSSTPNTYESIISKRRAAALTHYEGYMLAVNSLGTIYWVIEDTLGNASELRGKIIVNDGNWHQIVATRNFTSNEIELFIDGQFDTSAVDNISTTMRNQTDFWIGRWPEYNRYFNGNIDEVSVFNSALDTARIKHYINCPPQQGDPNLISYWNFNEGTGNNISDFISPLNTGSLNNGPNWQNSAPSYNCVTSINKVEQYKFSVFPNPVNQFLRIRSFKVNSSSTKIEISDINGIHILAKTSNGNILEIDVSRLNQGIYFISLFQDGNFVECQKFIKG